MRLVAKANKFGARRTVVDGRAFDSAKEARRYGELKLMLRAGEIADLELQPQYELRVRDQLICRYRADFRYVETRTGLTVVEDCKGYRTREYAIKRKLMAAIYRIAIKET